MFGQMGSQNEQNQGHLYMLSFVMGLRFQTSDIKEQTKRGIQPFVLEFGLIHLCQSPYNTPILPVQI